MCERFNDNKHKTGICGHLIIHKPLVTTRRHLTPNLYEH